MNIEEFRQFCMDKKGVTESIPFPKLPDVLVFKVMGKMFTATSLNSFDSFSIKCHPATIDELRASYPAVQEPSYFSKKHWCSVLVDNTIPDKILYQFLDTSYQLVVANLTKKEKLTLAQD